MPPSLKNRKALKGSYEELFKNAEMEAKEVKRERDETSQSKLSKERPAKRQKTEYQRYDTDHSYTEILPNTIQKTKMGKYRPRQHRGQRYEWRRSHPN